MRSVPNLTIMVLIHSTICGMGGNFSNLVDRKQAVTESDVTLGASVVDGKMLHFE